VRLTDTFCEILGDVVRPFVYCLIEETPQGEWGIAGVPMPDLVYLTSEKHANVIGRSNDLMRGAIAQMQAQTTAARIAAAEHADAVWRGSVDTSNGKATASANGSAAAEQADAVWRGSTSSNGKAGVNGKSTAKSADAVWRGTDASETGGKAAEHRRLFTRWFEELWNKKNYNIAYELVDADFTAHGAGGQDIKQGPDGVIGMVKAWHAAMPDGRMTVDDIITEGDLSTIRMTWEATHTGKFGEIPASGKRITVTSIGIDRVIGGKITEGWGELNLLGMLQQMGAIPQS